MSKRFRRGYLGVVLLTAGDCEEESLPLRLARPCCPFDFHPRPLPITSWSVGGRGQELSLKA
jgi:hypothetical protein